MLQYLTIHAHICMYVLVYGVIVCHIKLFIYLLVFINACLEEYAILNNEINDVTKQSRK